MSTKTMLMYDCGCSSFTILVRDDTVQFEHRRPGLRSSGCMILDSKSRGRQLSTLGVLMTAVEKLKIRLQLAASKARPTIPGRTDCRYAWAFCVTNITSVDNGPTSPARASDEATWSG